MCKNFLLGAVAASFLQVYAAGLTVVPATVLKDGFTATLTVDLSRVTSNETLYVAGPMKLALRLITPQTCTSYDRCYGNYVTFPLADGTCPVLEATITEKAGIVGIPLGALTRPDGLHDVTLNFSPVQWTIRLDGLQDETFPIPAAPVTWPAHAYANTLSPRVKEAILVTPAKPEALPRVPEARRITKSIQYWTPPDHNAWVGDVAPAYLNGTLHVFYLFDRRHHSGGERTGRHQFAHLSTTNLLDWYEHPLAVPIRENWQTCGTGTPFLKDGRVALAFGWHTSRYPECKGKPLGGTYAVSADGIHFANANTIITDAQNPSIYNLPNGGYELVTSYGGAMGIFHSADLLNWKLHDGKLPFRGDCPSLFDWHGHRYLLQGFVNMAYSPDGKPGSFVNWKQEPDLLYEGLSVPMVTGWKNNRRIYAGWLNHLYGWGGWLVFREVVYYPDGHLGLKWIPELTPPVPPETFCAKGGARFVRRYESQTGTAVLLTVDPATKTASWGDAKDNVEFPARKSLAHNVRIGGVRGLDTDYSVRIITYYDAKADATIFDAEIASQRTLIARRKGKFFAVSEAARAFACTDVMPLQNNPEGRIMTRTFGPYPLPNVDRSRYVALGTGGLTNLTATTTIGSYAFLALADPQTHKGYVAGWLTDEWASGSVHFGPEGLTFRAEYGRLKTGADVSAQKDTFVWGAFDDCREGLEQYAELVARKHGIVLPPQISGFCTWYCDKGGFTTDRTKAERGACSATSTRTFIDAVQKAGLAKWGFDYYQIDDTWQDGIKQPGPAKVFHRVDPKGPYPAGMKPTADYITAHGFIPGLWYMPFSGEPTDPWWQDKMDLFVTCPHDAPATRYRRRMVKGQPYATAFGAGSLDMSNPKALDYVRTLAHTLTADWGYRLLKFDGMYAGLGAELGFGRAYAPDELGQQVFHDPTVSNVQAFRRGVKTMRAGCAPGTQLLACNVKQNARGIAASYGLVEMLRIGGDNGPIDYIASRYMAGPIDGSPRYFLNGRVWYNDPDPVYVRNAVSLSRARLMATWTALGGLLYNFSDWLPDLAPERLDILKRTLAPHRRPRQVRPVDLFETPIANIWKLTDGDRAVFGLYNWNTNATLRIDRAVAQMDLDERQTYVAYDFWEQKFIPPFKGRWVCEVPPDSCRVWAVRAVKAGAAVLSTSRHVASPLFDVTAESWDPATRTLSGVSTVVPGEPYEIRVVCAGQISTHTFLPTVTPFVWHIDLAHAR